MSHESSFEALSAATSDYMLSTDVAKRITDEVRNTMAQWHNVAHQCGISTNEQNRFAYRFENL